MDDAESMNITGHNFRFKRYLADYYEKMYKDR